MEKHGIHMENEWKNMEYVWRMSEKHDMHMENEWKNMAYIWRMSGKTWHTYGE